MLRHARPIAQREQRVPEIEPDVDGQLARLSGVGETADGCERLLQMGDGVAIGSSRDRAHTRVAKIAHGLVPQPTPQRVMRQSLGLLADALLLESLDRLDDAGVKGALTVVQQPLVCDVMRERMLEGVLEVWEEPRLVEKFCGL